MTDDQTVSHEEAEEIRKETGNPGRLPNEEPAPNTGGGGGDADSAATGDGPSGGAVSGGTGDGDSSATGAGPSGGA